MARIFHNMIVTLLLLVYLLASSCECEPCTDKEWPATSGTSVEKLCVENRSIRDIVYAITLTTHASEDHLKIDFDENSLIKHDSLVVSFHRDTTLNSFFAFFVPSDGHTKELLKLCKTNIYPGSRIENQGGRVYVDFRLFDLTDTTSLSIASSPGNCLWMKLSDDSHYDEGTQTMYSTYVLEIDQSLISMMTKDSSVVRIFPEYYEEQTK